ncbi:MAG: prepilin peptidase [Elusimicrobia bacterium]|nr:prepilin peptidase [Elusimicrobiota bacterium]
MLIWRLPKGELPWAPPYSYCPHCRSSIKPLDNIPIISFLILRGRGRCCGRRIAFQYLWVEVVSMLCSVIVASRYPPSSMAQWVMLFSFCFFQTALLAVAAIDWQTYTIPDLLSLGLCLVMFLASPANELLGVSPLGRMAGSLGGMIAGGGIYWLFAAAGKKIYKVEAMGGGDVKLAAAIVGALGWRSLVPLVAVSSALGLAYALPLLALKRLGRRDPIAYGPFLSVAAIILLWMGPAIFKRLIFIISS